LLQKKSAEFETKIEERLVTAYKRIRGSVRNGLAIVPVERGASGGSYFTIPPQIQLEILSRNKIIMDEHSGRILIDAELAKEEQIKISKIIGG
jgi:predicted  nucleic acid-binding Zn-ribbon protein